MSQPTEPRHSMGRVLAVVLPVAVLAAAAYVWSSQLESTARQQMSTNVFARMLTTNSAAGDAGMAFTDADGDLVADSPSDPEQCVEPEVLVFSFVAGEEESVPEEAWEDLFSRVGEKSGHEVDYVHFATVNEQLEAMGRGELHVAGLNTGVVPSAVERDGFVPLCTFGEEDGSFGYTMEVLVPADAPLEDIAAVRGHKITFTRPDSNSGCKALLVLLKDQYDMQPDRDYQWGFSLGHEESIQGVAAGELEVAPVASDILARLVENGQIDPDAVRSIYKSERFPPATIGYVYNLTPELREAIRESLIGYELRGTELEGAFGPQATRLVPINYKDAWANARRINQVVAQARSGK